MTMDPSSSALLAQSSSSPAATAWGPVAMPLLPPSTSTLSLLTQTRGGFNLNSPSTLKFAAEMMFPSTPTTTTNHDLEFLTDSMDRTDTTYGYNNNHHHHSLSSDSQDHDALVPDLEDDSVSLTSSFSYPSTINTLNTNTTINTCDMSLVEPSATFFDFADCLSLDTDLLHDIGPLLALAASDAAAMTDLQQEASVSCSSSRKSKKAASSSPAGSTPEQPRKRAPKTAVPDELKNDKYWRRRLRNTLAAKRNREQKKMQKMTEEGKLPELMQQKQELEDEAVSLRRELKQLAALVKERLSAL